MFASEDLIYLALLGLVLWFWKDSLQVREHVIRAVKRHCEEMNVQFLDQGVNLARMGLARGSDGRVRFRRVYRFDISIRGDDRRVGHVAVLGRRILHIDLDLPEGHTITPEAPIHRLGPG